MKCVIIWVYLATGAHLQTQPMTQDIVAKEMVYLQKQKKSISGLELICEGDPRYSQYVPQ